MTAAFDLIRRGENVLLLEASDRFGGRCEPVPEGWADFPLEMGGSWLYYGDSPGDIVQPINVQTTQVPHAFDFGYWDEGEWTVIPLDEYNETYGFDQVFVNYTWYDFVAQYLYPTVKDNILFDCLVNDVDYTSADSVVVTCSDSRSFRGSKVVVAVPLGVMQDRVINFDPPLPQDRLDVLDGIGIVETVKGFLYFSASFWDQAVFEIYDDPYYELSFRYFWDAGYAQDTNEHILAFIAEKEYAVDLQGLSDQEIVDIILASLQTAFGTLPILEKFLIKDWTSDPFIRGGWSEYSDLTLEVSQAWSILYPPIDGRIVLAGEYLEVDGFSASVDAGGWSGNFAACVLLGGDVVELDDCTFTTPITPAPMPSVSSSPTVTMAPSMTPVPSVEPTRRRGGGLGVCFSGQVRVRVDDARHTIPMQDVRIGDRVLTSKQHFEPVYGFGHYETTQEVSYLQVYTSRGHHSPPRPPLEISKDHMLFVQGFSVPVPASYLKKGDVLLGVHGGEDDIGHRTVVDIVHVTRKGAFAPFTPSGTIVVNDVMVSCFVSFQGSHVLNLGGITLPLSYQWLAHAFETPHRIICKLYPCQQESYNPDTGISSWVELPLRFGEWVLRQPAWVSALVVSPFLATFSILWWIEYAMLHICHNLALIGITMLAMVAGLAAGCRFRVVSSTPRKGRKQE